MNERLTKENAHPNAKEIMNEDFFWSDIDESGPFGNDDGSDGLFLFREWRASNPKKNPVSFIDYQLRVWEYPVFDRNELNSERISDFVNKETQVDMSGMDEQLKSVMKHLREQAESAGQPFDEEEFLKIMTQSSQNMGRRFLDGQDNLILSVAFGQYATEGKIHPELKSIGKNAIKRQLMPILIDSWDESYRETRKKQLTKMLDALDSMNE
ncbi:hypothetical protein [Roseivirga pacifica]|nr:hypothetical protein [Roseivirga pacifica]MCO6360785.1 hypothetical protein [Roseivirga pacifica]MCO6372817.1 hypothetical protein [Roseivirga pacifica]MCO6376876.1 hypothetical protein [Roseivirga pacifica]